MIYQVGEMQLNKVREVLHTDSNDVSICQDRNSANGTYYTLWVIFDNKIAKQLIELFQQEEVRKRDFIASFTYQDSFCMVFNYKPERFLQDFYMGNAYTLNVCESICIHLIMECISMNMPYAILYLILEQNQIHMANDYSIYFSYQLDLSKFDPAKKEKDCVAKCAQLLVTLLKPHASVKAISYKLLERKIAKEGYTKFTELYKDIKMAAAPAKKIGIIVRTKAMIKRNQDKLMRWFLVACSILGVIVLFMLISQMIYGDVPFMRFLINPFKMIGTESMLQ